MRWWTSAARRSQLGSNGGSDEKLASGLVYLKISPSEESSERETIAYDIVNSKRPDLPVPALRAVLRSETALLTTGMPGLIVRTLSPALQTDAENAVHRHAGEAVRQLHDILDDTIRLIAVARADLISASRDSAIGFVHGDFQPRNWLWSEPDGALGIIDFEEASTGFIVEDFAWLFVITWPSRPDLRESFLSGYGKDLGSSDLALLESFTVLASLRHIADGVRVGNDVRIANGRRALAVSGHALLDRLASA